MNELVNRIVESVWVNDDNTLMVFDCGENKLAYETQSDCCSETWFSSINGLDNLLGHRVISVLERPEIGNLPSERQEVDILYGYILTATHPEDDHMGNANGCEIEFRNASNGYYGGSCRLVSYRYDLEGLTQVTKDF